MERLMGVRQYRGLVEWVVPVEAHSKGGAVLFGVVTQPSNIVNLSWRVYFASFGARVGGGLLDPNGAASISDLVMVVKGILSGRTGTS